MMFAMSASVLETLERHTALLAERGVESPRLQSELLLAAALGLPRLNLYLDLNQPLSDEVLDRTEQTVRRRANREPFQQIVGSTSFCGLDLAVRPNVFIPRPETELLAERALNVLKAMRRTGTEPARVLDFGTGTGCLAIYLAANSARADLVAMDQSEAALDLARGNAARHGLTDRIRFCLGNTPAALPPGDQFNLVVSNPPYIPTAEIPTLAPEVRDFDPPAALDGGPDGLDCYRMLADTLPGILAPDGYWLAEFGDGQAESLTELLGCRGWFVEGLWPDYSGRLRMFQTRRAT